MLGLVLSAGETYAGHVKDGIFIDLADVAPAEQASPNRVLKDFRYAVGALAISPDGATVAVGLEDGSVLLLDSTSGQEKTTFNAHRKRIYSLAFSPDGRVLASCGHESNIYLWDVASGERLKELEGHRSVVYALAFSPDGKTLASGSHDRNIILWDTAGGQAVKTLEGHRHVVKTLAFSPDGKTLASGSHDRNVIIWDTARGEAIKILEGHRSVINAVAFSPDGRTIASAGKGKEIMLWDLGSGSLRLSIETGSKLVYALAFSPDGSVLAAADHSRKITLWDPSDGSSLKSLEGHTHVVNAMQFGRGGRVLASGGNDRSVILWQVGGGLRPASFSKGEFETTAEYEQRIRSTYLPYSTPVELSEYDADRGGYTTRVAGVEVLVKVPRDSARIIKGKSVLAEGVVGYYNEKKGELINAYLVEPVSGMRFPFGKHKDKVAYRAQAPGVSSGAPELSYDLEVVDGNRNGILEGGESISVRVKIRNTGSGSAEGVGVEVSAPQVITNAIGSQKRIGQIAPGSERAVEFSGLLPTILQAGNVKVGISVREERGYAPLEVKSVSAAMRPAEIKETTTVLSKISEVDIIPSAPAGSRCDNCYGVVIGISRYRNSDSVPEVKYARKDAEIVAKYLEAVGGVPGRNIKLLTDESATKADIASTLEEWLPRRVDGSSKVFVYYAGHGTPDPKSNEAFIVPYEGEPGYAMKLYPLDRLYKSLNELPSKQVLVMLDSCFSGAGERSVIQKGARPMSLAIENPLIAGGKVVVIAASGGSEISSDFDKVRHGLFTYYLLRGMKGDADFDGDGVVRVDELFDFVRDGVSETAVSELDREQNPVLLPGPEKVKGGGFPVSRVR